MSYIIQRFSSHEENNRLSHPRTHAVFVYTHGTDNVNATEVQDYYTLFIPIILIQTSWRITADHGDIHNIATKCRPDQYIRQNRLCIR